MRVAAGSCRVLLMLSLLGGLFLSLERVIGQDQSAPAAQSAASPTSSSGAPVAEDEEAAEIPLPLRPYLVTVELSVSTAAVSDVESGELVEGIRAALNRMYGRMWDARVRISDWLLPGSESLIRRLTVEQLRDRYSEYDVEKAMLISVAAAEGGWNVSCREYDCRVQELTPAISAMTYDRRGLPELVSGLTRDCFRPVLYLSAPAKGTDELEFLLQAGELIPPDPSALQIQEGDVLRPFVRHMERRDPRRLRLLQRLDLTYIRVTEFNRELARTGLTADDADVSVQDQPADDSTVFHDRRHVKGVLISHGVAPYGGRGRNSQQLALRQRPMSPSSRVQLVLKTRPDRPLICHRVDRVAKLRYRDESQAAPQTLVSDRNGELELSVDPQHSTFWLYVYSGSLLLARVPYAPGLLERDVIQLPDDTIRLSVEGELYLFRDNLIDVVAQRAVLKGMAKQAAESGDAEQLEQAVKELVALPGRKEFEQQLNAIQVPAVRRAEELKNRSAVRQVNKLCQAMSDSLAEFFSAEKQVKELEEVERLRQLSEERSAVRPAATSTGAP